MAPSCSRANVHVVFSDMFLDDGVLRRAGMSAAHVWYNYPLIQQDWPKPFGPTIFNNIEKELRKMLYAFLENKQTRPVSVLPIHQSYFQ